ncbi:MAG: hypothetical protein ABIH17_03815 [Pseudomonadota bacterium]
MMISSRLYYASMMLFWVCYLALLALVVTYAPQGGVGLAGLTLFADTGLVDSAIAAMQAIGMAPIGQSVVFGLLGGFSAASAGLLLFAMMFYVFGEEREQREARPLAQGAVACTAAASMLSTVVFFAGGQAGTLLALEFGALGGLFLTVMSLSQMRIEPDETGDAAVAELDRVIADHAANHAAYSAQLASLNRQGNHS